MTPPDAKGSAGGGEEVEGLTTSLTQRFGETSQI